MIYNPTYGGTGTRPLDRDTAEMSTLHPRITLPSSGPLPPAPPRPPIDPSYPVPPAPPRPPTDPAYPVPPMRTGGPLPPQQEPPVRTGGPLPPQQVPTGTPAHPPVPATPPPPAGGTNPNSFAPADVVNQTLEQFLNGPYAADARRRGAEMAGQRGLINSGMAAGNSERAALEGVQPFVQEAMGLLGQREDNAFKGEMQSNQAFQQDWLNSRNFNRDFYAQMSMIPMNSAAQLQQMMAQYALENPDVYTPNNMAGMSQFFNQNLQQIMAQYFGGATGSGG